MKVLIADEDAQHREHLAALLKPEDNTILFVDSGMDAMDVIESESPPDLILMDWNMPGLSGVEVATLMRETQEEYEPYVIILADYSHDEKIIQALSYGADDYIHKPVDADLFRAKLAVAERIVSMQEKLKRSNQMLEKLAYYDDLTGVLNRRAGNASFMVEVERCIRKDQNMAIAMVDIDHFKKINDTYGHQAGDKVLKIFAQFIQKTLRPYDIVCRYGGEEFLLILEIQGTAEAEQLFERVRERIATTDIQFQGQVINITASFGVYVVTPSTELSLDELVAVADEALYEAKQTGRNKVEVRTTLESSSAAQI
jgi:diguanylate cyclase (GGDEF)-like protein